MSRAEELKKSLKKEVKQNESSLIQTPAANFGKKIFIIFKSLNYGYYEIIMKVYILKLWNNYEIMK